MAYQTLYRKYRPQSFDEVVGQDHIVKTIKNAIKENKIAHAYLFCGPRGTGKTTMAKLLAKACNCEAEDDVKPCNKCLNCTQMNEGVHPDIIELDAASNNGVEQIREIVEKVKYTPIVGKYKVYIIDEVHMLSTSAFNALLKTLEEPPMYVIFILATTDPQKVLPTIISRCQRYNFLKVSKEDIAKKLAYVLDKENVKYEKEALLLIGELADGGLRDALSILEQALAYNREIITLDMIASIFGVASVKDKIEFIKLIQKRNYQELMDKFDQFMVQGINLDGLINDLMVILKELIVYDIVKNESVLKVCSVEQINDLYKNIDIDFAKRILDTLIEVKNNAYRQDVKIYFEIGLLKLMDNNEEKEIKTEINKKVSKSERVETQPTSPKEKIANEKAKAKEEEEIKREEITEEIASEEIIKLDNEFLLGLLIQGNKEEKEKTNKLFEKLNDLKNDIKVFRYAKLLLDTEIYATGKDFIILNSKYDALKNEINEKIMNEMLFQFINNELGINKMIYAVNNKEAVELINEFRIRRKNNDLPIISNVKKYEVEETKEEEKDEVVAKLEKLVGKDNFNVEE